MAKKFSGLQGTMRIKSLNENAQHIFEIESKATDIFALCGDDVLPCGLEKTENIIIK